MCISCTYILSMPSSRRLRFFTSYYTIGSHHTTMHQKPDKNACISSQTRICAVLWNACSSNISFLCGCDSHIPRHTKKIPQTSCQYQYTFSADIGYRMPYSDPSATGAHPTHQPPCVSDVSDQPIT